MKLIQESGIYDAFIKSAAASRPLVRIKAPGRMNLIGEHTDYNGGKVLPFAINKEITLTCRRTTGSATFAAGSQFIFTSGFTHEIFLANLAEITALAPQGARAGIDLYTSSLDAQLRKSWAAYAMGALYHLAPCLHMRAINGEQLWIHIDSDLPVGAGISSSAALTTGLLAALFTVHGVPFVREEAAKQAMLIEHHFVGTKCGLMDQLAVLCAKEGSLLMVDFLDFPQHQKFQLNHIKAHPIFREYQLVGLNTGVKHNLSDSPYNERRAACESMVGSLNNFFKTAYSSLGAYAKPGETNPLSRALGGAFLQDRVRSYLQNTVLGNGQHSEKLARFAAHAICENGRVDAAAAALLAGDAQKLDALMLEGHLSLQHDYQVSCDELDAIAKYARCIAHQLGEKRATDLPPIIGPRMTGGGFGGSTIQMVHHGVLEPFIAYFSTPHNASTQHTGIEPKIIVTPLAQGLTIEHDGTT